MLKKSILAICVLIISTAAYSGTVDTLATIELEPLTISANLTPVNRTPLRLKVLNQQDIAITSPGKTYPEILSATPGVFASSQSGSYGDASINIRGFKQENISILLNGVPISGLTSGSMFWNNWAGLVDATNSIELQKGVGASMLSDNSVGGTISINTIRPDAEASYQIGYYYASSGTHKGYANINSGNLGSGWSFALSASYAGGDAFAQATDLSVFSYLASVSKNINSEHKLLFTALGSPERHQQRSARLSYEEVKQYGRDYNKNWGYDGDKARTISENKYFKPYFQLNHSYTPKHLKLRLNTALYLAIGDGGGLWTDAVDYKSAIINYQKGGLIDWAAVKSDNRVEVDPVYGYKSQNIMSDYQAGHTQFGLTSNMIMEVSQNTEVDMGLHYQMYRTWEQKQIIDLLGGHYWYEDYENKTLIGAAGRNPYKKVGDLIGAQSGRNTNYLTMYNMWTFFFAERKVIFKAGVSISGSTTQRWDKYNYVTTSPGDNSELYSDIFLGIGGSLKTGVLWKINYGNSLYLNAGVYSRTPYANVIFASGNNNISEEVVNEKNAITELGYRFVGNNYGAEVNLYSALWVDKSMMSQPYNQEDPYKYMIKGLKAIHQGIEIEAFYKPTKWLKSSAFLSLGNWKWLNDVSANFYDPMTNNLLNTVNIYTKGLNVGDAPQTQIGAAVEFDYNGYRAKIDWAFNDRHYADFDPATRTNQSDKSDSYRFPSYHLLNLSLSWTSNFSLTIFANANNLLDSFYIERGKDGNSHNLETFTGYWGQGRNFNIGLRYNF